MPLNSDFSNEIFEKIDEIANERQKGAAPIAKMTLNCFLMFVKGEGGRSPEEFWNRLVYLAKQLIFVQPDMAPQFTLTSKLLMPIQEALNQGADTPELIRIFQSRIDFLIKEREEALKDIAKMGVNLIQEGDTVMTHSHSSSVRELLLRAHRTGCSFEVIVTESRPGLEGKFLAEELRREGIATTLIPEASAFEMLSRCQKVFFGADRVTEHYFVNKVGTRAIALLAKETGVDVVVVCDTSKFVPGHVGLFMKKKHTNGIVLEGSFPNVMIGNPYFEVIPLSLVTVVVCEVGLLPPSGVASYLQQAIHFPELLS